MGVIEIGIIVAAGIFLLWLWRGGGQSAPVASSPACAKASCGPPRAFGCLGVLFALMIAAVILLIGFRSQRLAAVGLALFTGMALLLFAGRWARGVAVLGMFALIGLTVAGIGLISSQVARQQAHRAELEHLHWVDEWLDGPAARFSPFHRAQVERVRAEAQRAIASERAEISRWNSHLRRHKDLGGPIPALPELSASESAAMPGFGATLYVDLKPNAITQGNVRPNALAATLLAMIDLIAASDQERGTTGVPLGMLHRMDVLRSGQAIPLSQIARIRKESLKGVPEQISQIAVTANDKSKRPQGNQLREVFEYLQGVERNRQSQNAPVGFHAGYSDSGLLIVVEPALGNGIPVEAALAAATPEAPPPAIPSLASPSAAPPAAPAPAAPVAPKPKLKTPIEGTVPDLLMAYEIMMWTLPESLGGAAEFKPVSQPSAIIATSAPVATEIAQTASAEPVAPAAVAAPTTPASPATQASSPPASPEVPTLPAPAAESVSAARPKWLEGKAEYLDNHGDYFMRRSTGRLYQTTDESHEAAAELLVEMTRDYVTSLLGKDAAAQVAIPIHTVLHDFVEATFDEQGPPPGLPDDDAWETHVLLKFDNTDRQVVEQAWRHSVVDKNLRYAGAGAGLLLALMGTVFGYLKVDTATRGYYSGRLKLAAGAILAAITTLGILLVAGTLRL